MKVHIAPNVLSRVVDDEVVLLNLDTESYFGLDEAGAHFWKSLESEPSYEAALQDVCDEFEVDREQADADLRELVEALVEAGLLTLK